MEARDNTGTAKYAPLCKCLISIEVFSGEAVVVLSSVTKRVGANKILSFPGLRRFLYFEVSDDLGNKVKTVKGNFKKGIEVEKKKRKASRKKKLTVKVLCAHEGMAI